MVGDCTNLVRGRCHECGKYSLHLASLRLGIFGLNLCSSCLKELGAIATHMSKQIEEDRSSRIAAGEADDVSSREA